MTTITKKIVSVSIDETLLKTAKKLAINEGIGFSNLVAKAITNYVKESNN